MIKTVNIRDVETSPHTEVWVANTTSITNHLTGKRETPETSLQITGDVRVMLPSLAVPVLLTDYASKKEILSSPHVRKAVSNRLVALLCTDSVNEALATDPTLMGKVKEAARISKTSSDVGGSFTGSIDLNSVLGLPSAPKSAQEPQFVPQSEATYTPAPAIRDSVYAVVSAYNTVGTVASDVIAALHAIGGVTAQERNYLLQQISDPAVRRELQ